MKSYSVSCRRFPNSRAFSHSSSRRTSSGGREVEDVLVEVRARALRELLEARGRERHAVHPGVELHGVGGEPPVPGRERGARAGLLGARAVAEPRVGAPDLGVEPGRPGRLAERARATTRPRRAARRPARTSRAPGARCAKSSHEASAVPFARAEEREEDRGGKALGVLQDVAVREGEDGPPADAREERVELGDPRRGLRPARQREPRARAGPVQDFALGVEEDGILPRRAREARLVEAEDERPRRGPTSPRGRGARRGRARARGPRSRRRGPRPPRAGGRPPPRRGGGARAARRAARRGRRARRPPRRRGRSPARGASARSRRRTVASAGSETAPRETGGSAARSRVTYARSVSAARSRSSRAASACPEASSCAGRRALARHERVEARGVARGARDDARAPQEASRADAADAMRSPGVGAEVRASVREEALEGGRSEVARDEVEDVEDALAGTRVRDGHAVRERAGHAVLGRELVDERPVRRVVVEDDLDLVEAQALVEDAAEDGADLVLLAQGVREGDALPGVRRVERVLGEGDGCARPGVEERLLEGRELEAGRAEEMRGRREPASSGAGGRRPLQDLGGVRGAELARGSSRMPSRAPRAPRPCAGRRTRRSRARQASRGRGAARRACGGARGGARRSGGAPRSTNRARGPRRTRSRRRRGAARAREGACPRRRGRRPRRRARARRRSRA